MTKIVVREDQGSTLTCEVRDPDQYSKMAHVTMETLISHLPDAEPSNKCRLFLGAADLEVLGNFFLKRASEIRQNRA